MPVRLGPRCQRKAAKAALLLASPGGAADPPVRASHLRRDKPIDGKEESLQATRLPLQEEQLKVLFRWAT
jgi:hypothetical protein